MSEENSDELIAPLISYPKQQMPDDCALFHVALKRCAEERLAGSRVQADRITPHRWLSDPAALMEDRLSFCVSCLSSLGELTRSKHFLLLLFRCSIPTIKKICWLFPVVLSPQCSCRVSRSRGDSWVAALSKCHKSPRGHMLSVVSWVIHLKNQVLLSSPWKKIWWKQCRRAKRRTLTQILS